MSDAPDKFWMWSSAASKGVAGFWSSKEPGPWDANPDARLVQIVPDAELARLRELKALVREWQKARAEATKTTDEYLRQVRPSAFAIVRLTQAEQALSAWRPT
jgi:hypothetical protein